MVLSDYLQRFDKAQLQQLTQGLGVPLVLLAIMGMVILPMPPLLLDVLFSFNIALSLVIILVAVFTQRPVDFGIFPLVLLIATVLRLALNVASTRVVLLYGHEGGDSAALQVLLHPEKRVRRAEHSIHHEFRAIRESDAHRLPSPSREAALLSWP